MEITIATGIFWKGQERRENGCEVDAPVLCVVGRILQMAPKISVPW